jgi:hypothetical protein
MFFLLRYVLTPAAGAFIFCAMNLGPSGGSEWFQREKANER